MFRCLAAIFQTVVASITAGSFGILFTFVFAGFVIPPRKISPHYCAKSYLTSCTIQA